MNDNPDLPSHEEDDALEIGLTYGRAVYLKFKELRRNIGTAGTSLDDLLKEAIRSVASGSDRHELQFSPIESYNSGP